MAKKSTRRFARMFTLVLVLLGIWFAWEWRQQDTQQQTKGVQTVNPSQELLSRCLQKAKDDYDRDLLDSRASPAPNLAELAAQTYEFEKATCLDLYGPQ